MVGRRAFAGSLRGSAACVSQNEADPEKPIISISYTILKKHLTVVGGGIISSRIERTGGVAMKSISIVSKNSPCFFSEKVTFGFTSGVRTEFFAAEDGLLV